MLDLDRVTFVSCFKGMLIEGPPGPEGPAVSEQSSKWTCYFIAIVFVILSYFLR